MMAVWIARFIELLQQHDADAYARGVEDAANICETMAIRQKSAAAAECALRVRDLLIARQG